MPVKAKLELVKPESEVDTSIDFKTIEELIGRPAEQKANRVLYDFPKAIVTNQPKRSVFKRMLSLSQYFKK